MEQAPKLFISYSWSSPGHEQWVIDLATQLRESGVDVILDKWDLKEGHDSIGFMEKMVTDPTITKVAVISDKTYADKADGRAGGVGTETQIISREVYEKQDQSKFVAVIPEKDEGGKPYVPTYYKGRIHIDLSEPERYADNFEKLLRWIYDKPLHVKPELGKAPAFLDSGESISLGTAASQYRLLDAIRNGKLYVLGAMDEYLSQFSTNMERFRLTKEEVSEDAEAAVIGSIEKFMPARNEFVQILNAISQYLPTREAGQRLHRFFERIQPYGSAPVGAGQWNRFQFDNFKFVVHELFLCTQAILIRDENFDVAAELLAVPYYMESRAERTGEGTTSYPVFRSPMEISDFLNQKYRRLSRHADLLKERAEKSDVAFRYLMQADFVLYLRAALHNEFHARWWPETLVFATHMHGPFEVFARSRSKPYFDKVKVLLGVEQVDDIKPMMAAIRRNDRDVPSWQFDAIDPHVMLGYDNLAAAS